MPNCFQLMRIGTEEPVKLSVIDEEICRHLGIEVHPRQYAFGWYDIIGFGLACGRGFDDFIFDEEFSDNTREIARFLRDHYHHRAWYSAR